MHETFFLHAWTCVSTLFLIHFLQAMSPYLTLGLLDMHVVLFVQLSSGLPSALMCSQYKASLLVHSDVSIRRGPP